MIALTPDQKRAAEANGCVAVTAGAGTGKTGMLAKRYLHHVGVHGLSPLAVVAVTFTEKAAAELRSRIRLTLIENLADEKLIAEIEAAQISTIHSLAARICRDFYDLAGIPADFAVLDETESPLWEAEKFDEALAGIDADLADELGFKWLVGVLKELLRDPIASERALSLGAENWRQAIDQARQAAIDGILASDVWKTAASVLPEHRGAADDTLEVIRGDVVNAMAACNDGVAAADCIAAIDTVLKRFKSNSGSAKKWDAASLDRVRECLSALKARIRDDLDVISIVFGPEDEEAARRIPPLADAFRRVRDHIAAEKLREKVLDFNDLEHYALKVLGHPEAVGHYRLRWKAFLVDEFQDTNPVQAEIIGRLADHAALTIVGDEKQSIYGFRGADTGVFSRVSDTIVNTRGGERVPLSKTFRTHSALVRSMNDVFEQVLGSLHQPLDAHRAETTLAEPYIKLAAVAAEKGSSSREQQVIEARYIAKQIAELNAQGVAYRDMAIIARRWAPLEIYESVLSAENIPAVNAGGGSLLATREALDIYSLIAFLAQPHDPIPLAAVLRSPYFAVSDKVLHSAAKGVSEDTSWWDVIRGRAEFAGVVSVLDELISARDLLSAEQLVRLADRLTGYGAIAANLPQGLRRTADINGVYGLLRTIERRSGGGVFATARVLRELYLTETEIKRPPVDAGDAVVLMTIHHAKGLEWPVVFIPDLTGRTRGDSAPILIDSELGVAFQMEGDEYEKAEPAIFKLIKLRRKQRAEEESRRLLYVAVTRAKDKVILTAGKQSGSDLDILAAGLESAGVKMNEISFDHEDAVTPSPGDPEPFSLPATVSVEPVRIGIAELSATDLTLYARCPKAFEYMVIDGNPGISDGYARAREVGTLTHLALELDIDSVEDLRARSPISGDGELAEAVDLAARFRARAVYEGVRGRGDGRELRAVLETGQLSVTCIADVVGGDFVLDHKTDAEMYPDEHRFQLWAYARAFKKQRALIAYLRHDKLYEFDAARLAELDDEAQAIIGGIRSCDYTPRPSTAVCGYCPYRTICPAAVNRDAN